MKYVKAEAEVVKFDNTDIISTKNCKKHGGSSDGIGSSEAEF